MKRIETLGGRRMHRHDEAIIRRSVASQSMRSEARAFNEGDILDGGIRIEWEIKCEHVR